MRLRLNLDYRLIIYVFILLGIGLPMVFSASHLLAYRDYNDALYFFQRQAMWAVIGLVAMFVVSQIPYRVYQYFSVPLAFGMLAVLALVDIFGSLTNGARRWALEGSVQPSELAKLVVIIYVGHWLTSRRNRLSNILDGYLPFLLIVGVSAGLIALQPDLSTAIVLVVTAMAMFFAAGAPILQIIGTLFAVVGIGATMLYTVRWRMARLLIFIDPLKDKTGDGFQIYQMLLAMSSGGLTGHGFASLTGTVGYLPASHTDAIFAVVGNDFGFIGCTLVIILYALLAWRGMAIAQNAADQFGRILAVGISVWLASQALLNIASATASVPFTGIPLPFISLGGSALVSEMIGIGILLNIALSAPRVRQPNARMAASLGRPAAARGASPYTPGTNASSGQRTR
jgi:cell division protein FtsW